MGNSRRDLLVTQKKNIKLMSEFKYQPMFEHGVDNTEYELVSKDYVKVIECDGRKILKVEPEGLAVLAKRAYQDVSFYLRASHLEKLASILADPEATDNDKFVAHTMIANQVVAAEGQLPTCQDTGTAIAIGKPHRASHRHSLVEDH